MVRVWDAFLQYAKSRPGVALLRKDEIARFVLQSPLTLRARETIGSIGSYQGVAPILFAGFHRSRRSLLTGRTFLSSSKCGRTVPAPH
jgi:hypothetical protein